MTPGARISAAIDILSEIAARKRPAAEALKDWGVAHRFAGSGDRAAIGNLVFDTLRKRTSAAYAMGDDSPRAIVLRTLVTNWGLSPEEVATLADGSRYAPAPLSEAEQAGLDREIDDDAPPHVRGDYPEWLAPEFARAFGSRAAEEGAALAERAPVDLRVNTLKANRDKVLKALRRFSPEPTPHSPLGIRIVQAPGPSRSPHVEAEAAHGKGWFEVQDEGSQLAALFTGAAPKQQIIDLCAGAGGKTLALAALMQNSGQLYAYDADRLRLRPIFERLKRAGARNVQVLPARDETALRDLGPRFDVVFIDAPCTGSGAWRRRPDSKWRLKPASLAQRVEEQHALLTLAAPLVKSGGQLVYVTCSVLPEENGDQIARFAARHPGYAIAPWRESWAAGVGGEAPPSACGDAALQLTPARHGTDGFFVAVLDRAA